jgi:ParB-like chromosome segregation protein Spo0J
MTEATPTEPGHSPWLYETREVPLTDITVLTRLRPLEPALVDTLAASMKLTGLTYAIVLRPAPAGYYLVVGWHRLEAARKLGWQAIRAVVFWSLTSDQAALLEIESNLIPTLTPDERAKLIAAPEEITEGRRSWKAGVREFFGLRSE